MEKPLAGDGADRVVREGQRAQELVVPRVAGEVDLVTARVERPRQDERPHDVGQRHCFRDKQDPQPADGRLSRVGCGAYAGLPSHVAGDR